MAICQLLTERADEARQTLRQWKRQWTKDTVTLGGQSYSLFTPEDDPCEWLQRTLRVQRSEKLPRVVPRKDFALRYFDSTAPGSLASQPLTSIVRSQWTLEVHGMPGKADTSLLPTPSKRRTVPLATPVYAGGLVICGTPGNRFVASDAAAGATVWSCPIEPPDPPKKVEIFPGQARGPITIRPGSQLWEKDVSKESDRWVATEVIICGDRLLLTPVDADSLYCADLKTGQLLWDSPRGDGLYVVAAGPDTALIVGQKSLRAIRVENGQPAWEQAAYPDADAAAGRGPLSGDRYALPLGSGQIAVYDTAHGKLAHRIAPDPVGPLGNLLADGNAIYSVTAKGTSRFSFVNQR